MLINIQSDAAGSDMEERQSLPTLLPDVPPSAHKEAFKALPPVCPLP